MYETSLYIVHTILEPSIDEYEPHFSIEKLHFRNDLLVRVMIIWTA